MTAPNEELFDRLGEERFRELMVAMPSALPLGVTGMERKPLGRARRQAEALLRDAGRLRAALEELPLTRAAVRGTGHPAAIVLEARRYGLNPAELQAAGRAVVAAVAAAGEVAAVLRRASEASAPAAPARGARRVPDAVAAGLPQGLAHLTWLKARDVELVALMFGLPKKEQKAWEMALRRARRNTTKRRTRR